MKDVPIGINGFGRIGRLVLRAALAGGGISVRAINDLTDAATLAHLFKYDSTHGRFEGNVSAIGDTLIIDDTQIRILSERDPSRLPWSEVGAHVILESTGVFAERDEAFRHLAGGAARVVISQPAQGEDITIVLGVNDSQLRDEHIIISNASCTTNCLAPMAKVLHENFGVVRGMMNTIHSYTNDQSILDLPHKDLRRARSAALSVIPTTTGAAAAVGKVLPALNGKLDGLAVRVPTADGSLTDFTVELARDATAADINEAFRSAAAGPLSGIIEYSEEPLVLADIIGNPASCVFDALSTNVVDGNFTKVLGWYDNEWGYANRCADLLRRLGG